MIKIVEEDIISNFFLNDVKRNTGVYTKIFPGLFVTFMGGTFDDLLIQIHKTREFHYKGAILFDYAHLSDEYIDALKTRIYNNSYDRPDTKIKSSEEIQPQKNKKSKRKKSRRKNND